MTTHRFVDGAYFENSGVEGAAHLVKAIKEDHPEVRVLLLVITSVGHYHLSHPGTGLGETLAPIRTMLSTREARGNLAISNAMNGDLASTSLILLNRHVFPLPLGWQLSAPSQFIIREHSGHAGRQLTLDQSFHRTEKEDEILLTLKNNDAEACRVQVFLNPDYDSKADTCATESPQRGLAR